MSSAYSDILKSIHNEGHKLDLFSVPIKDLNESYGKLQEWQKNEGISTVLYGSTWLLHEKLYDLGLFKAKHRLHTTLRKWLFDQIPTYACSYQR